MGNLQIERGALRRRLAGALKRRTREGVRDERGAVAIIFAFAVVVLVPMVLGLFDLYTASEQKARLQDAVDAAALYAARSELTDDAEINALATKALNANLKLIRGATLVSAEFRLTDNDTKVVGSAVIKPLAIAPALFPHHNVSVGTEVVRNSRNLEVALVLDVTGSMKKTSTTDKIGDLRIAAKELVDLVVKDQQLPFYSKVAVVPWSMGVNVGSYANQVRGTPTSGKTITNIAPWFNGTQKTISTITKGSTTRFKTSANHGFTTGWTVLVTGVTSPASLNLAIGTVTVIDADEFTINVNSSGYSGSYSGSAGRITRCVRTDCRMVVTANGHGLANNDYVFIDGVSPSGLDSVLDDNTYQVNGVTTNTYNIFVAAAPMTAWTSGGASYCTKYGCEYYRFMNADSPSAVRMFRYSACVSERTGTNKYTDVAPSTSYVGFNYPSVDTTGTQWENTAVSDGSGNPCLTNQIVPLSTDREGIKTMIGGLQAAGSTAGQIGTAWGWYMVSPEFAYLWPNAEQKPAAYTKPDTIKVVVLMTDGALNSPYCNGVIAKNALSGSGSASDHHDCNATNGTTLAQSLALCEAMRAAGVKVYTVGFQITGDTNAETLMRECADDADHQYLPTSGSQLKEAFKAIGAELNNLRLAH